MPRKKKDEVVEQSEAVGGVSEEHSEIRMTKEELRSLELHEARMKLAIANTEKVDLRMQLLKIEYDKNASILRGMRRDEESFQERARDDYVSVRKQVEGRLGVSLNDYSVSDEGVLIPSPE